MKFKHIKSGRVIDEGEYAKVKLMKGFHESHFELVDDDADKSDLSADELEKSCAALEAAIKSGDRKGELLEKARQGELEKSERDELMRLVGGTASSEVDDFMKSLRPDENQQLGSVLDVSDYLNIQHRGLLEALEGTATLIEKGQNRQHDFNLVLAKSLVDTQKLLIEQHKLIKSLEERLGTLGRQPAREPKSTINKSQVVERQIGGQPPPPADQLTKSEVNDVFSSWIQQGRRTSGTGENLLIASSKFEQFNTLSPALKQEVEQAVMQRRHQSAQH